MDPLFIFMGNTAELQDLYQIVFTAFLFYKPSILFNIYKTPGAQSILTDAFFQQMRMPVLFSRTDVFVSWKPNNPKGVLTLFQEKDKLL